MIMIMVSGLWLTFLVSGFLVSAGNVSGCKPLRRPGFSYILYFYFFKICFLLI
ncbi:hypothetical protein DFH27DRAFT_547024 [Peziza echinospora]|nr:hypothetical protein DFH27DRAFT_547024 [Peziza echinospora]